ncbi:MAG: fasciclin domain-containing protein [Bacteroidetes bacterium]|nr:fasciclin domain-containing protein [Bacteroidota bacterium]
MKTIKKFNYAIVLALAGLVIFTSCKKDDEVSPEPMPETSKSIVEIATTTDDFTILTEALIKADLVSALQGEGPYTVFAPTNSAFNMLFNDLGVNGIQDIPAETLKPILLYHVVAAKTQSTDITTGYYESLNMNSADNKSVKLYIQADNQKAALTRGSGTETGEIKSNLAQSVMINGSTSVVTADVQATNGVIHIIDKVLLPPTVVDFAISNPSFSILVEAVVKAGLVDALSAEGPFTVFAPTNEAFESLFAQLNVSGIADLSAEALTPILLYHVLGDNVISSEVAKGSVPTLNTEAMIDIDIMNSKVMLNGNTTMVAVDVQAANGVIHVIDNVLLP